MLFNSVHFVLFFILVTGFYFLFPYRFRWALLLAASCYFYMVFKPIYILILFFTIIIDYFAGIYIDKAEGKARKNLLLISLIANVGILAVFKYFNFFNANLSQFLDVFGKPNPIPFLEILLPIGLSFHTFQAMSYTIEVYRGKQKPERHFGIYALYVMFYPQLVAGPIERPQNVIHQFHEKFDFDYYRVVSGLRKMAWGMFKKIVIADRLAVYVNQVYGKPEEYTGVPLILATVLFAFQIYCDFSGYSDIALGSARVMGFDLMQNFNRPYFSKSISEFWKRWHISLSTWFRDYLYIPLGGNRVRKPRLYFNLFFTFLISGFWHGASWNYVIWGSLHGFYLILALVFIPFVEPHFSKYGLSEKTKIGACFHTLWTFALVCIAWVFFRATSFHDAVYIISNFTSDLGLSIRSIIFNTSNLRNHFLYVEISKFHLFLGLAGIFILLFVERFQRNQSVQKLLLQKSTAFRWSIYMVFSWYFLLFGMFGSNQQFTYFQF